MDPNPRGISGTKAAMLVYIEQSGRPLNLDEKDGYKYGTIKGHPAVIANPVALYRAAQMCDLQIGKGGSFAVVGYNNTTNEKLSLQIKEGKISSVKIIIANVPQKNASEKFLQLEDLLTNDWEKVLRMCEIDPCTAVNNVENDKLTSDLLYKDLVKLIQ